MTNDNIQERDATKQHDGDHSDHPTQPSGVGSLPVKNTDSTGTVERSKIHRRSRWKCGLQYVSKERGQVQRSHPVWTEGDKDPTGRVVKLGTLRYVIQSATLLEMGATPQLGDAICL